MLTEQNPAAPHVIRFRVEPGTIELHDLIRGDVAFEGDLIDDFVLLRSDKHPTYHLSVVVDDIDMAITHVARGDDHLSNTPKHVVLFRAFGAEPPLFAHVFSCSTHHYLLRDWLHSGGVDPDMDVRLCVMPPPQMPVQMARAAIT